MMFLEKFVLFLLVISSSCQTGYSQGDGNILDRIVRIVWDPSGLVYFWTGLDQFFNIVRSWRGVALNLLTLPFRQPGKFGDHIKINGRTRALGQIKKRPVPHHLNRATETRKPVPFHHIGHQEIAMVNLKNSQYQRPHIPMDIFVNNKNPPYGDWTVNESKLKFRQKPKRRFPVRNEMQLQAAIQENELQRIVLDIISQQRGDISLTQPNEKLKTLLYLLKELQPDMDGIHAGNLNM